MSKSPRHVSKAKAPRRRAPANRGDVRPLLTCMRRRQRWLRAIAVIVAAAFLNLYLQPVAVATQLPPRPASQAPKAPSHAEKLSHTLEALQTRLEHFMTRLDQGDTMAHQKPALRTLRRELDAEDQQAMADFDAIEHHLKEKKLPQVILERHYEAVRTYRREMQALKANLRGLDDVKGEGEWHARLKQVMEHLKAKRKERVRIPVDPNKLPFRLPSGKARQPKQTSKEFRAMFPNERVQVAALDIMPGMLTPVALSVDSADLAPTEDVQITDEIRALAASLNNNPARIYNWVHNNIYFAPTYGSIQGSQMCLRTRQCNAFDTSSLLIALLRASGIPARYVYGTVQIPVEKMMNWVGGVTVPDAALQLLGQGGIPSIGVVQGGTVAAVRLEHVWVEAFVDFHPSRGVVQKRSDSWVPLDPSFKQYKFGSGIDIKTNVPVDVRALVDQVVASAQTNASEGWITGIDQNLIQSAITNYQTQAKSYLDKVMPDATAQDLLGTKSIVPRNGVLAASLPYRVTALGSKFASIPDKFRYSLTLKLFASELDQALDSPELSFSSSLVALANKRLGVTYKPATAADAELLQSYIDQQATTLPAYLIHVKPVVQVDGVDQVSGSAISMGQAQAWDLTLTDPAGIFTSTESYKANAGDEIVFGIDGAGITPGIVHQRSSTTPTDTAAENLNLVALYYWMEYELYDDFVAASTGVVRYRLPSAGSFSSPLTVTYIFGIARSANYQTRVMDVKRVTQAAVRKDGGSTKEYAYTSGIHGSNLEGVVFEQLFGRPVGAGISAIQLLRDANAAGIRIYRITSENVAAVLPTLSLSTEVKADIQNAAAAGKEIIAPQAEVLHEHGDWRGTGYLVLDPATGAGAYLIDGGLNGGADVPCDTEEPSPQPLVVTIVEVIFVSILIAILISIFWPEFLAGAAALGGEFATAFRALILASGLLAAPAAEASFNRNAACTNAINRASTTFPTLEQRIAEYIAAPVRDQMHYNTIQEFANRLEDAIRTINRCCRVKPPQLATWTETVAQARGLPLP